MMAPHNRSITQLAIEESISEATFSTGARKPDPKGFWCLSAIPVPKGGMQGGRFVAVMESASLNEQKTVEYWRRKGIFPNQLNTGRQDGPRIAPACYVAGKSVRTNQRWAEDA